MAATCIHRHDPRPLGTMFGCFAADLDRMQVHLIATVGVKLLDASVNGPELSQGEASGCFKPRPNLLDRQRQQLCETMSLGFPSRQERVT